MTKAFEVNFDGLVGPTHNYAGLSFGNVASLNNKTSLSNPKEAALQGLHKMRALSQLGLKQAIIPPQERPDFSILKELGFDGDIGTILQKVKKENPELLSAIWSASSMWTANAATVSPSFDSADRKVHFTPANLSSKFHRSIEPNFTSKILKKLFSNPRYFSHHSPLPAGLFFSDEGAANHTRLSDQYQNPGVQLFVFGRKSFKSISQIEPKKFPARQTFEASQAIARLHQLGSNQVIFAQQNPDAIDAGVFHNDVASVGNLNVLLYHEEAFLNSKEVMSELKEKFNKITSSELKAIQVPTSAIRIDQAVQSYLFNSQLLMLPTDPNSMVLVAPTECQEIREVHQYLTALTQDSSQPIREVKFFDLRQSMRNGGGPACLRLRVILEIEELKEVHPNIFLDEDLYQKLITWVKKYYRDRLEESDLLDLKLVEETRTALDELTQILNLGSIYPFQN